MNSLEKYLSGRGLDEIQSMNALQDADIVSDNCVLAQDVAECDCTAAIAFLAFRNIVSKPQVPAQDEMNFQSNS